MVFSKFVQFLVPMANCFYLFFRYVNQTTMVDHIFPPQNADMGHVCSSHAMVYSTFTYWREPVEDIQLHFEDETKNTDTNDDKKIPLETVAEEVSSEAKNAWKACQFSWYTVKSREIFACMVAPVSKIMTTWLPWNQCILNRNMYNSCLKSQQSEEKMYLKNRYGTKRSAKLIWGWG